MDPISAAELGCLLALAGKVGGLEGQEVLKALFLALESPPSDHLLRRDTTVTLNRPQHHGST
jgi:hypothetical protein